MSALSSAQRIRGRREAPPSGAGSGPDDLGAEWADGLDGTAGYLWLGGAALLTGWTGHALWANWKSRRSGRVPIGSGSVVARWGEEHDAGLR